MGLSMGGAWEIIDQAEWRPDTEPPHIHPGWEVVTREQPRVPRRRRWLPTRRHFDLVLGTLAHACLGALLTAIMVKLLIELAG